MVERSESVEDHLDVISNFKEVCAVDDDVATGFLRHNDWNLEIAVQHFFQSGGELHEHVEEEQNFSNNEQELRHRRVVANGPSTSGLFNSRSSTPPPDVPLQRRVPPPITWTEFAISLIRLPFLFTYHSILEILYFIWALFRSPPLSVTDPRGDVHAFVEDFNATYGNSPNAIQWVDAPYNDALDLCRNSLRFLIVYLHNPSHEACERFIRNTLLSQQMRQLIDRNQIVMWGASVRSQEGYKVSMALRENTYPFLGLLCMKEHRMVMVLRLEGEYELEPMLYTIQTSIDENQMYLNAVREERNQREANNRIRREQEAEYQRGLAEDKARLNQRKREETQRLEALRREEEEKRKEQLKKEKFQEIRAKIASELPPEYKSPDHIRVSVRFPCGARFERSFSPDDSLEKLFNATLVHEKCPVNFSMVSSYPREQLNCAPEWYREYGSVMRAVGDKIPTFRQCGFDKSVMVLVQDNDA